MKLDGRCRSTALFVTLAVLGGSRVSAQRGVPIQFSATLTGSTRPTPVGFQVTSCDQLLELKGLTRVRNRYDLGATATLTGDTLAVKLVPGISPAYSLREDDEQAWTLRVVGLWVGTYIVRLDTGEIRPDSAMIVTTRLGPRIGARAGGPCVVGRGRDR